MAAAQAKTSAPTIPLRACERCDGALSPKHKRFCSKACYVGHAQVARTCKQCAAEFFVYRSVANGSSNASANFCGRPCYHAWLGNAEYTGNRGHRWRHVRAEAIRRFPFCALCGSRKLQVHHIVPYRVTKDNAQSNLVPLCTKHHKRVEAWTNDIVRAGAPPEITKLVVRSIMLEHQIAGLTKLRMALHG